MTSKAPGSRSAGKAAPTPAVSGDPESDPRKQLITKLQILAAVFLPIALVCLWLGSKGFFQSP
ncbi:MAG: hypothetical protein ACK5FE_10495 [Cyanobacteriota bacterium]|jgi:hypothetical protein